MADNPAPGLPATAAVAQVPPVTPRHPVANATESPLLQLEVCASPSYTLTSECSIFDRASCVVGRLALRDQPFTRGGCRIRGCCRAPKASTTTTEVCAGQNMSVPSHAWPHRLYCPSLQTLEPVCAAVVLRSFTTNL